MTLSERERRELAAIEYHFVQEDPRLVRRLRSGASESPLANVFFAGVMFAGAVCGAILICAGVARGATALIALGAMTVASGLAMACAWFGTRRDFH
jgi:hypothetical protein